MAMLFKGCGTALVTPFVDGKIDWDSFGKLLEYQVGGGVDALVACGTTGEPSTLSLEEQVAVVEFVVKNAQGLPVIAGIGGNDTAHVKETAKIMQDTGADGLLAVTPYYNKTTQDGLVAHYFAIAEASELPIIVYNVPSRTGLNLLPKTTVRLAEHERLVALKEASTDLSQIMKDAALLQGKMDLYSGNDDIVYPFMTLGGAGVISVASNLVPQSMHDITALYESGDFQGSLRLQQEYAQLISLLFSQVSPIPVKAALAALGLIRNELRLPLVPLSDSEAQPLYEHMEALGLL